MSSSMRAGEELAAEHGIKAPWVKKAGAAADKTAGGPSTNSEPDEEGYSQMHLIIDSDAARKADGPTDAGR